jgi:hypothetical protein
MTSDYIIKSVTPEQERFEQELLLAQTIENEINDFLEELLSELSTFNLTFLNQAGYPLVEDESPEEAYVQSFESLNQTHKGQSLDIANYVRTKIKNFKHKLSCSIYHLNCLDCEQEHRIIIVIKSNSNFVWLEALWSPEIGIHKYDTLVNLFLKVTEQHREHNLISYPGRYEIRPITGYLTGRSYKEILDDTMTQPVVWKSF